MWRWGNLLQNPNQKGIKDILATSKSSQKDPTWEEKQRLLSGSKDKMDVDLNLTHSQICGF